MIQFFLILSVIYSFNAVANSDYLCEYDCYKVRISYDKDPLNSYFIVNTGVQGAGGKRITQKEIDSYSKRKSNKAASQEYTKIINEQDDEAKSICKNKIRALIDKLKQNHRINSSTYYMTDDNGIVVTSRRNGPKQECKMINNMTVNSELTRRANLGTSKHGYLCNSDKVMLVPADGLMATSSKYYSIPIQSSITEKCIEEALAMRENKLKRTLQLANANGVE